MTLYYIIAIINGMNNTADKTNGVTVSKRVTAGNAIEVIASDHV